MRTGVGDNTTWQNALAAQGIQTGLLARFDFTSATQCIWTGSFPFAVSGTGDSMCDGQTFQPIADGIMVNVGDNQFSYSGSEALVLSLAIPQPMTSEMAACVADSTEWQGRTCILWRAVIYQPATATAPLMVKMVRVRAGTMDELAISNDGQNHTFNLTVEAHASRISNATGSTYLDQKTRFDSTDTSQDYALSIANNPRGPQTGGTGGGPSSGTVGAGGGGGSIDGGISMGIGSSLK